MALLKTINYFFDRHFAWVALLLIFLTDGINKFLIYYYGMDPWVSKCAKAVLFGMLILMSLSRKRSLIIGIVLIFVIGQFTLNETFTSNSVLAFGNYVFTLLTVVLLFSGTVYDKAESNFLLIFERLIALNSILILIGFIFNVYWFKTYAGERFGYNGLFQTSAVSTYVYGLTLIYLLVKYKHRLFHHWMTYLIIIASLFIGTKGALLFLALILLVFVIQFLKKQTLIFVLSGLTLVLTAGFYYLFYMSDTVFQSMQSKHGLLSAILSFRNEKLMNTTLPYITEQWNGLNYLFGGLSDFGLRAEMAFIDIVLFFGILGAVFYCVYYYGSLFGKIPSRLLILCACVVTLVAFLAGNYFSYSSIAIYSVAVKILARKNQYQKP